MAPSSTGNRRSILVLLAVLGSLFLAIAGTRNALDRPVIAENTDAAAALQLTTNDMVQKIAGQGGVQRAAGGYVPGQGVFITAEMSELASGDVEQWARGQVNQAAEGLLDLPPGEEVVFLLDIGLPQRTSRLLSIDPSLGTGQRAPATSTTPITVTFDDADADADTEVGP